MKTDNFWKNKKVLITGGTSGLGLSLHRQLTDMGALTALVARKEASGVIRGDVSDKRQIHRIYAEAITELGHIDVLFNNASSLGPTPLRLLMDTDCEDFELALQTNLIGPFRLTKLVAADMILRRSGVVVNISSDAAVNAYPKWGAYAASKAALDHMTRIFQAELAETGVQFLALDPGDMNTPLHLSAIPDAEVSALNSPEDSARLILEQIAAGKFQPVRRRIR